MQAVLLQSQTSRTSRDHLLRTLRDLPPFTPAAVLVPTTGVITDLRGRVGNSIGISFFQFYSLGEAVLQAAAHPVFRLNDTAVRRVIRAVLEEMRTADELTSYSNVQHMPGFVEALLNWLREMKTLGILPEDVAANILPTDPERDRQLASFYRRYQEYLLARDYADADGQLWLAAEELEKKPRLFASTGPVYVYGFDQFPPVQLRILKALMGRSEGLQIYLPWDPERAAGGLALARLEDTRQQLLEQMKAQELFLPALRRAPAGLAALQANLFERAEPVEGDGSVRFVEAPSREAEVRLALREVKKLLLEGVTASEIALAASQLSEYQPLVRTIAWEYGLPVSWEQPLMELPPVQALRDLLMLSPGFDWRSVFAVLRSPYVRQTFLTPEDVDLLDQLSRERPVTGGEAQWRQCLQPVRAAGPDGEEEDRVGRLLAAELPAERLAELESGLSGLFDLLTPEEEADTRAYVWWVQTSLLGIFPDEDEKNEAAGQGKAPSVFLADCAKGGPHPDRDRLAVEAVLRALRRLLFAEIAVPETTGRSWEQFREAFLRVLNASWIEEEPDQPRVRFEVLAGARGRPVEHLFVLGLAEGEYPSPPSPDPLYAPAERAGHPLRLVEPTPADSASLWWQVIGSAGTELTLLRPYIDENGAEWQASPYWDAAASCFSNPEPHRIGIAHHPGILESASVSELVVALAASRAEASAVPPDLAGVFKRINSAEEVIRMRMSFQVPGPFEGRITAADLRREIGARYGPGHIWSASRLNRYANCPYGFFAENVLGLEARKEPEEGLDAMQRGSLLHEILERLLNRLAEMDMGLTPGSLDAVLAELDAVCSQVYRTAPAVYGFRPSALWLHEQEEMKRLLRALLRWECEENPSNDRFRPHLQEAAFGVGNGPSALTVTVGEDSFRLRGLIDRLDRDSEGNLRVVDYKSGTTTYSSKDISQGLALQTVLYALAAEAFWTESGGRVAESVYLHIPARKESGKLSLSGEVLEDDTAFAAAAAAMRNVLSVRHGEFPASPAKPAAGWAACRQGCDFEALCRVTRQSVRKGRQGRGS